MALDYLTQGNGPRGDPKSLRGEKLFGDLSEAEKALQELANVFLQHQSLISSASLDLAEAVEAQANPEAPLLNMEASGWTLPGASSVSST